MALVCVCVFPTLAGAATFVVNRTTNGQPPAETATCGTNGEECTLREAIKAANATTEHDTITFAGISTSQITVEGEPLPEIFEGVTIEGDTAGGTHSGKPSVEIVSKAGEKLFTGIEVEAGEGTRIEDLAIGDFEIGIRVSPPEGTPPADTEICGSYIGLQISGAAANGNEIGVEVVGNQTERPSGTVIGDGVGCAGNVISGNELWGIVDAGEETVIGADKIGVGVDGSSQPNGAFNNGGTGGVKEGTGAVRPRIGGIGAAADTIADNFSNGVLVEESSSEAKIRASSIFANGGAGIEVGPGALSPMPTLTSVSEPAANKTKLEGTIAGIETGESAELDFFANAAPCASNEAQGETYLGTGEVSAGAVAFSTELPVAIPVGENSITATATLSGGTVGQGTSEFSACFSYEPPARTLTVNTDADADGPGGCVTVCSLREAIEVADASKAADTIDFAASAEGVIRLHTELPKLTEPVEIDGTSAPGYNGAPVVLVDGSEVAPVEGKVLEGLSVEEEGGGSVIRGMAVGGFEYGVFLDATSGSRLCSSWIGVELDGQTALPNMIGVETGLVSMGGEGSPPIYSPDNQIGVGCAGESPNVIAGNSQWGVVDLGLETSIGGNTVGIDPAGSPLPNGRGGAEQGGIEVARSASRPTIGGTGAVAPNTIAYNKGPAVLEENGSQQTVVRANHIYGNEGKGIEIDAGAPTVPTITAATGGGTLTISGEVSAAAPENVELDFYASNTCASATAQGESLLGTATIAEAGASEGYVATVPAPSSDDQSFVTVTATGATSHLTSEFSECFRLAAPPTVAITTAPQGSTSASTATFEFAAGGATAYECSLDGAAFTACSSPWTFTDLAPGPHTFAVRALDSGRSGEPATYRWTVVGPGSPAPPPPVALLGPAPGGPAPVNGEKVVVEPEEGKVLIKLPGTKKFVPLTQLKEIPVGAVIDATHGRVKLTSIDPDGTEQTAEFFGGVFRVKQKTGAGLVVLELLDTRTCPASASAKASTRFGGGMALPLLTATASAARKPASSGKLWGSGHGNFRTEGHDGSATVEGTIWLVEDRCDGTTFFRTRKGIVKVRDFVKNKSLPLPAGKTYLAGG
jgi:CSLREA domain-containing protein